MEGNTGRWGWCAASCTPYELRRSVDRRVCKLGLRTSQHHRPFWLLPASVLGVGWAARACARYAEPLSSPLKALTSWREARNSATTWSRVLVLVKFFTW